MIFVLGLINNDLRNYHMEAIVEEYRLTDFSDLSLASDCTNMGVKYIFILFHQFGNHP